MKINKVLNEALWQDISESSLFLLDGVIRDIQSVLEDELPYDIKSVKEICSRYQDEHVESFLVGIERFENKFQDYSESLTNINVLKNDGGINIDENKDLFNSFKKFISKFLKYVSDLDEHIGNKYEDVEEVIARFDDLYETCSGLPKLIEHALFHLDFYEALTENINKG